MSSRRAAPGVAIATVLLAASLLAGCASTDRQASKRSTRVLDRQASPTTPTTTAGSVPPCSKSASYEPAGPPPPPGVMPPGPTMASIISHGYITVGVDETTKYWSLSDPSAVARFRGFEIDLAVAIAHAIWGNVPDLEQRVHFVTVTTEQKFAVVKNGDVDMTIDVASMACDRWQEYDFSSPYYEAIQQLVVPYGSPIMGQDNLYGKRVCVTKTATAKSSSGKFLDDLNSTVTDEDKKIIPVEKFARLACLTKLQEGKVDAIVLPNSIVYGLVENDPTMVAVPTALHNSKGELATSTYGVVIRPDHRDLTLFVNSLFEQWRRDGTLQGLLDKLPEGLQRTIPPLEYRN